MLSLGINLTLFESLLQHRFPLFSKCGIRHNMLLWFVKRFIYILESYILESFEHR